MTFAWITDDSDISEITVIDTYQGYSRMGQCSERVLGAQVKRWKFPIHT